MRAFVFLGIFLFFCGCGYFPSAYYAQKVLGDSVYVKLIVNLPNPENSVQLKDALNRAVISRFQSTLASQKDADSIITIEITDVTDTSIATNEQGFTTFYRAFAYVTFTYANKRGQSETFKNTGYYDYAVSLENPLTTYNNRFYAIEQATNQTIDKFITQVSYQGK
ncbi:LPS assembly lipoprotein LptE [Helicobacter cappadocius]|uniref:LPS assembly lipoprotein LptE n=1 Tax=Helicobacter cappadocius TaxID=3063998 RepID=A0AA90PJW9_9HELI|nr:MULTISPECIES: LPS assembly lipoprotein LptE [unclassified Helicobacter]MDO7253425.1 LPS assembly lipoprotein LptE [Helicobacter sp. faydin-H75]MDP2539311.1 LPS assembly lipoprotein LptE [Helicobacter sp. faydin-H76]